jgi:hypothetical protein
MFTTDDATAPRPVWKQITTRSAGDRRWATTGLEAIAMAHSVGIDPGNPATLYIPYGDHGMFKSEDGGRSLRLMSSSEGISYGGTVVVDERKPSRLYFVTRGPHLQLKDGQVHVSEDGGESWRTIGGESGGALADDESDADEAQPERKKDRREQKPEKKLKRQGGGTVLGTLVRPVALGGKPDKKEKREKTRNKDAGLENAGDAKVGPGLPRGAMTAIRVQYLEGDQRRLFVCNYAHGLYVKDGAAPWQRIFGQRGCRSLAARGSFEELYVGVDDQGIFKLTKRGEQWTPSLVVRASSDVGNTFFDLETGAQTGTIYAGTSTGIFALDRADRLERRLPVRDAMAIEVQPRDESVVYAASPSRGLLKSTDRGATWKAVDEPPPTGAFMVLKFSPTAPDTVYAVARCAGVWKMELADARR